MNSSMITTKNLAKYYNEGESQTRALRGVSITIQKSEFLAIMGPSGSGKSTLLHLLGLLDRPTDGEYLLEEKDPWKTYSREELAKLRNKKMGFIFQQFHLLPRATVLENVSLPLLYSNMHESLWKTRAMEVVKAVGLSHRSDHAPSELSGGEKQRVAIARALVNDPEIIFADEPTGNLDSVSGKTVMQILQKLNELDGRTIILVTHETHTSEYADRIVMMQDGKIESDRKVTKKRRTEDNYLK